MNTFIERALNELIYTEKNIETMQKYLKFLRNNSNCSMKDISSVMVKSNGEPLTPSTYTKFEMEEGQRGRIRLSIQNTINLYKYFYNIAYKDFKNNHFYLINFLTSAFYFYTDTKYYSIKNEDIQEKLLEYFFSLTYEKADKKIIFPDMYITEQNIKEWNLPTYKKEINKPIHIWGSHEWEVPGIDYIFLITKGEKLRKLLSYYFKPITRISGIQSNELADVLGIATSGLKYYETNTFEISLSQAIELLKILPENEDIISIIELLLIFTETNDFSDIQKTVEKNILDYSKAKNILSKESVALLYKLLIEDQIFYIENNFSNFLNFSIEKKITIEYLLKDKSLDKFNNFTKNELINILRYGHK